MEIFQIDAIEDDLEVLELVDVGFPRQIYSRYHYFESFHEVDFFKRFRLKEDTALCVLAEIEHRIEYPCDKNNSVSAINQLLVTLRFCATGSHLLSVVDFGGIHISTCCRIIKRVSEAIASEMLGTYVKFPSTTNEINEAQADFYSLARFPKVIGAIDGTQVKIQSPGGNDAEVFRNRKHYFSINVQAISSRDLKFTNIVARWPGSCHDATIFNNSSIKTSLETGAFGRTIILGDSAYALKKYILTPLLNPQTRPEQLYNEAHIRTRGTVEKLFGTWKRRFPIVAYGCRLKLSTTLVVIVSTAILHNVARIAGEEDPPIEDLDNIHVALVNANIRLPPTQNVANINDARNEFIRYFGTI